MKKILILTFVFFSLHSTVLSQSLEKEYDHAELIEDLKTKFKITTLKELKNEALPDGAYKAIIPAEESVFEGASKVFLFIHNNYSVMEIEPELHGGYRSINYENHETGEIFIVILDKSKIMYEKGKNQELKTTFEGLRKAIN